LNKNITIAGLGWLGLPLAQHLKLLGYKIKGSVTDSTKAKSLSAQGIKAYSLILSEEGTSGEIDQLLDDTDVLLIMIPPGLRRDTGSNYALKMAHFITKIEAKGIRKAVLVSSTAVYDDTQGLVTEKDVPKPDLNAAKQLFDVEQLFFNMPHLKTSIIRFGGLFGGSRNPVKFLAGRSGLRNGNAPVNLIHRDDCIGILSAIIKQDAFGHIFNAVMPEHPLKKVYYKEQALKLGLEAPQYEEGIPDEVFKQIDSVHLSTVLNYTFKYKF